ncbi:hypothetical protein SESBI_47611 [Sesbania bispinosa]|nr:hypothetical protein SESBI_47611 [Sesbania bispinosa]
MVGCEGINPTDELAPNEGRRNGFGSSGKLAEDIPDARPINMLIQLHHLRAKPRLKMRCLTTTDIQQSFFLKITTA